MILTVWMYASAHAVLRALKAFGALLNPNNYIGPIAHQQYGQAMAEARAAMAAEDRLLYLYRAGQIGPDEYHARVLYHRERQLRALIAMNVPDEADEFAHELTWRRRMLTDIAGSRELAALPIKGAADRYQWETVDADPS